MLGDRQKRFSQLSVFLLTECTPPQRMSRCVIGLPCDPDAGISGSNISVSLPVTPSNESVDSSGSTGRELLLSLFLVISPYLCVMCFCVFNTNVQELLLLALSLQIMFVFSVVKFW